MAIPVFTSFTKQRSRPKDDIDPNRKAKDPKYSLDWSQYIYSSYLSNSSAIKTNMSERFIRNRKYAEGRQDTTQYKNWILGTDKDSPIIPTGDVEKTVNDLKREDLGMENINFEDVFSPLPKYVETIKGILSGQVFDVTVEAIDEHSGTVREEMKLGALVDRQLQLFMARYNSVFGIPDMKEKPVMPESMEELELFENIGYFKLPYEIAMEKAILHTFQISKFEQDLKNQLIGDLFVDGYASVIIEQDSTDGKFKPKRMDVLDLILEDSKSKDFSDASWGGYLEYYTVHKLRAETGWSEEKIAEIARKSAGQYGNPQIFDDSKENGQYTYDSYRVPVLHSYWKSIDDEYYTDKKTKTGYVQIYEPWRGNKPPRKRKNRETSKVSIRRLYHARWVIGSDMVFDYGVVTNTPYNFGKRDVEFPIRLFLVAGKPKIESMIPIEDQIYLTFIKTQNAIAKAAPPGLAIEWGAIQNIAFGKKKLTPKDSIRLYTNSGNIVYQLDVRSLPGQSGSRRIGKPVEELRGGLGTAIADGIQGIEFLYKQLDIIIGIDGLTSSTTTPNRDTGKAVSEMAIASTSNTLKMIYAGFINLKENTARVSAWMIQAMMTGYSIDELKDCPYYHVLGDSNLLALISASDIPVAYGFSIEARATDVEKQRILEAAQMALQSGKNGIPALSYSEYSFIVRYLNSGHSIKYLELWIAKKEAERQAKEQEIAQQNVQLQNEELRKTKQLELENLKTETELKTQSEIAIAQAKAEEERKTLAVKLQNDLAVIREEARIGNQPGQFVQ